MNYQLIILIGLVSAFLAEMFLNTVNLKEIGNAPVPEELSKSFQDAELEKNYAYNRDKSKSHFLELSFNFLLSVAVLYSGVLNYFYLGSEIWESILSYLIIGFIISLISLPYSVYQQFVIEEKHGFNNMTLKLFFMDFIKSSILKIVFIVPLLLVCIFVVNKVPNWWLYVSAIFIVFQLLVLFIYPIFIAPLFNKFELLKDKKTADEIIAACKSVDYGLANVYQMDGSKRSNRGNAYFAGFGKSKRVVFFDTLLNLLSIPEIKAVLYHEIGHKKCNHILKTFLLISVIVVITSYLMNYLYNSGEIFTQFGIPKSFISLLIIFEFGLSFAGFLLGIALSNLSRKNEFEADAFAKNIDGGTNLSSALVKLISNNKSLLSPHPWYAFVYYSHPTVAERIKRLK